MTLNNNTLTYVFGGFAALCVAAGLGVLFNYNGDKVQAFGLLTGLVLLFIPSLLSFKQSADAATKAEQSLNASQNNAQSLRVVKSELQETKVGVQEAKDGIDVVHKAVNHQQDLRTAEIAELRQTIVDERNESGSAHPSPTPVTDAIKLDDAARPPTTP